MDKLPLDDDCSLPSACTTSFASPVNVIQSQTIIWQEFVLVERVLCAASE